MFKSQTQNVNFSDTKCLNLRKEMNYLDNIKTSISKL